MGALSDQLAARLPAGSIWLNTTVTAVRADGVTLSDGREVGARQVIVATDAPSAQRLVGVPYRPARAVSCCWFAAPRPPLLQPLIALDGTGTGPANNVVPMSVVAPSYAPPGQHLIAAACPGGPRPDLESAVIDQLRGWFGPQVDAWRLLRTDDIAFALPNQEPPLHPKQAVRVPSGVYLAGDHRDTASIQGALFSGRRCAEAVLAG
jgi:phytoene dehydrogenase-like protein